MTGQIAGRCLGFHLLEDRFLKGPVGACVPQESCLGIKTGGKVGHFRPKLLRRIDVLHTLVVAVKIEHDRASVGKLKQPAFQAALGKDKG